MTHTVSTNPDTALSDYRDHLFQCAPPLYDEPLVLAEGSGNWVTDANGDQYLDFFAGILTTSLGHCHPEVNQRVAEQMATLGHTSTLYLTERQGEMAKRLAAIAPGDLDTTFFTNSGTEAVETAIMLACQATERTEIITLRYAYSGRSLLATNMTNNAAWRPLAALSRESSTYGLHIHTAVRFAHLATIPAWTRSRTISRKRFRPARTANPRHSLPRQFKAWAVTSSRHPDISRWHPR